MFGYESPQGGFLFLTHPQNTDMIWTSQLLEGFVLFYGDQQCRFRLFVWLIEKEEIDMFHLGATELIIILVIVILLFGAGRIGKIASEIGSGIRNCREGLNGDKEEKPE